MYSKISAYLPVAPVYIVFKQLAYLLNTNRSHKKKASCKFKNSKIKN